MATLTDNNIHFFDMIEYYGTQNAVILGIFGLNESTRLTIQHQVLLNRPVLFLLHTFKCIIFNRDQDIRRHDWPVGFHVVVFADVADQPIRKRSVRFSGVTRVGPWRVLSGRINNTMRRIRVVRPDVGTHLFVFVHEV